jgi:hypothetical protein
LILTRLISIIKQQTWYEQLSLISMCNYGTLYWNRLNKSLICFARKGLLISSYISGLVSMRCCSEKSVLVWFQWDVAQRNLLLFGFNEMLLREICSCLVSMRCCSEKSVLVWFQWDVAQRNLFLQRQSIIAYIY